jgi:hypothetical protein
MHISVRATLLGLFLSGMVSAAAAEIVTTRCGAPIRSITRTETEFFTTSSESPVKMPGTTAAFTVPPGAERCIRIRFSAIANCPLSCFVRAFVGDTLMNPGAFSQEPPRFSTDGTNAGTAHSFEWVLRVGPGRHATRIEISRGNTLEQADIGPYTVVIELTE